MTNFKLILKNLVHNTRLNLILLVGVAISTAILTGSLLVGDSVKYSLQNLANLRLGNTEISVQSTNKIFSASSANSFKNHTKGNAVPVLQSQGMAINSDKVEVNKVSFYGIDTSFKQLSYIDSLSYNLKKSEIFINSKLATTLSVKAGDKIILRIEKKSNLPQNAPFVSANDKFISKRFTIKKILSPIELGNFNLSISQQEPFNVFLSLSSLSNLMDLNEDKANTLLLTTKNKSKEELINSLHQSLSIEDYGLSIDSIGTEFVISTDRVFIEPHVSEVLLQNMNDANPVLTYFVNSIESKNAITPYSFATATNAIATGLGGKSNIIVNKWLSDDLHLKKDDSVNIKYFAIGPLRQLEEKEEWFTVQSIANIEGAFADVSFTPEFPGLTDAGNCRDWDAGIPIDMNLVRDKDEEYWERYKGTPKLYLHPDKAKQMWENRFGEYTSIRIPANGKTIYELEAEIKMLLSPEQMGYSVNFVKNNSLESAVSGVDFGELFLSLSFLILLSALILTRLLYTMHMEYRQNETGTYFALGFSSQKIQAIYLKEMFLISIIGSALGCILGITYNNLIIRGLNTLWQGATQTQLLQPSIEFKSLIIGITSCIFLSVLVIWFKLRKSLSASIHKQFSQFTETYSLKKKKPWILTLGLLSLFAAIGLLASIGFTPSPAYSGHYFMAGFLLLTFLLTLLQKLVSSFSKNSRNFGKIVNLSLKNISQNKKQSLTAIILMAMGTFVVFSTGANKLDVSMLSQDRKSGTGGFHFYGTAAMPILHDVNTTEGKAFYSLEDSVLKRCNILPLQELSGNDASCLNLNKIDNPALMGVPWKELAKLNAFDFVSLLNDYPIDSAWNLLGTSYAPNTYPVFIDQTVLQWSLGKKLGDTLIYKDEQGDELNLILSGALKNSIFQGKLLIDSKIIQKHYPSVNGYNSLLLEVYTDSVSVIKSQFEKTFRQHGLSLQSTTQRLASFNKVQNTYLSIFLALGGLGLILGTIGFGIYILRNNYENRTSFALLQAIGFTKRRVLLALLHQHMFVLGSGLLAGSLSALLASIPLLINSTSSFPFIDISITLLIMICFGFIAVYASYVISTKRNLHEGLRDE